MVPPEWDKTVRNNSILYRSASSGRGTDLISISGISLDSVLDNTEEYRRTQNNSMQYAE